jgi:prevent-host-death family protein
MNVVTSTVGIRELKARLSTYLDSVKDGNEIVVTERGQAVARIVPVSGGSEQALARLMAEGRVLPPEADGLAIPKRVRLRSGSVEELIAEQRQ